MVAAYKMVKFTGMASSELDHSHPTSRKQTWSTGELQLVGNTLLINDTAAKPAREGLSSYNVPPTLSTEIYPHCIHFKEQFKGIPSIFAMPYKIYSEAKKK